MAGRIRQERQRDAEKAIEAEFLEDARVKHRGGSGRGGIGGRRPGMKREEGDQDAEAEEQGEVDGIAGAGIDESRLALENGNIKGAMADREAEVERRAGPAGG